MNILIAEDCIISQNLLKSVIKTHFEHWSVDIAESYETALDLISHNTYNFFIISCEFDKNNSDKNGLSLGLHISSIKKYRHTPFIFVAPDSKHIVNIVNQLNCLYYLIKPYDESNVLSMIKKVLNYMPTKINLLLKDEHGIMSYVNLEDIIYIEANRHTLNVITKYRLFSCTNHSLASLSDLYDGLLIRCHKSYIVNPQYITFIDKTNFCLSLEHFSFQKKYTICIGRKYMKYVLTYNNYIEYF